MQFSNSGAQYSETSLRAARMASLVWLDFERSTEPSEETQESRREVESRNAERAARASSVGTDRSRLSRVTPC